MGKAGNENKCELPELNEIFLVHYVFVKKTQIYLWMNGIMKKWVVANY